MKRRSVLIGLTGVLALSLVVAACAPVSPHAPDVSRDCLSCHGSNADKPYPSWHAKTQIGNDRCLQCHDQASDTGNTSVVATSGTK